MQAARKLHRRSARERARAYLVEGPLVVTEALRVGAAVREVFVDLGATGAEEIREQARAREVPVTVVTARVLAGLAGTTTPQGIVAVVDVTERRLADLPATETLVVVLAGVQDPGNAGTLVRSAVAAAAAIVFTKGAVDPFNAKTVRASAGALFHARVFGNIELVDALGLLRKRGFVIIGADAHATKTLDQTDLTRPVALVLGNEAWGIDPSLEHLLDESVGIPMPGPAESLNVGIAGSILLFEAVRQRRAILGES